LRVTYFDRKPIELLGPCHGLQPVMAVGCMSSAVGAGKSGSAKLPTTIARTERPSKVQNTVDPHVGQSDS
jgi:hypothetical protein